HPSPLIHHPPLLSSTSSHPPSTSSLIHSPPWLGLRMNSYNFVRPDPVRAPDKRPAYDLAIRQQPERARVCTVKERERRPVDPPPIVQLKVADGSDFAQNYLQSPYFFMCANLVNAEDGTPHPVPSCQSLAGTIVSSLHRLKDVDNSDGGFFIFGDVSIKIEGQFRLSFSLFEVVNNEVIHVQSVVSQPFTVYSAKNFPGMSESTFLSRSFSDQGVRFLRIRKSDSRFPRRRIEAPDLPPEDAAHSQITRSLPSYNSSPVMRHTRHPSNFEYHPYSRSRLAPPNPPVYLQPSPAYPDPTRPPPYAAHLPGPAYHHYPDPYRAQIPPMPVAYAPYPAYPPPYALPPQPFYSPSQYYHPPHLPRSPRHYYPLPPGPTTARAVLPAHPCSPILPRPGSREQLKFPPIELPPLQFTEGAVAGGGTFPSRKGPEDPLQR
ncbi:hypothetical protein NEOLI_004285, partial [Neolecta irregularis DAH-3]